MPPTGVAEISPGDFPVAAFLLDTPSTSHGGSGRTFDWKWALEFKKKDSRPLILSGGLTPENVAAAIGTVHPYAVDVSSGVEESPGRKDHVKIRDFHPGMQKVITQFPDATGHFGPYGGMFVPETLMAPLHELGRRVSARPCGTPDFSAS